MPCHRFVEHFKPTMNSAAGKDFYHVLFDTRCCYWERIKECISLCMQSMHAARHGFDWTRIKNYVCDRSRIYLQFSRKMSNIPQLPKLHPTSCQELVCPGVHWKDFIPSLNLLSLASLSVWLYTSAYCINHSLIVRIDSSKSTYATFKQLTSPYCCHF